MKMSANTEALKLTAEKSMVFSKSMWKSKHSNGSVITILALEFQAKNAKCPHSRNSDYEVKYNSDLLQIQNSWMKWRYSFLRRAVGLEEVKEKILFIDAEFTCKNQDGNKSPVSVTILDYFGRIQLDEKICPRQQVIQIGTRFHGIKENEMRCKEDEYEVLERIKKLVTEKILIGHDLSLDLKYLHINPDCLLGMLL